MLASAGSAADLGYALARAQARHGRRPDASTWAVLHPTRSFERFLQATRTTEFAPWVQTLEARQDAHEVERRLRLAFHAHVDEVCGWTPACCSPLIDWARWAVELSGAAALLRGDTLPLSLAGDPILGKHVCDALPERRRRLLASPLSYLVGPSTDAASLVDRYCTRLRQLYVRSGAHPAALDQMVLLAGRQRRAMSGSGLVVEPEGWEVRADLEGQLLRLYRRHAAEPVALLCHLALTVLDLERLRAALLRRLLFPALEGTGPWG